MRIRVCAVAVMITTIGGGPSPLKQPVTPWEDWVTHNLLYVEKTSDAGWTRFVAYMQGNSLGDMKASGANLDGLPGYIVCTRIPEEEWDFLDYTEVMAIDENGAIESGAINGGTCRSIEEYMKNSWGIPL